MSRDDGFQIADVDSSYLEDAKMRALWQRLRDEGLMARAVLLHKATLLASWRHGERVTVAEAAPTWLSVDAGLVAHLQAVKLLDRDGKVSRQSWAHWFGAAVARRDISRAKGRAGGLAKARNRSERPLAQLELGYSPATAQPEPSSSPALPDRPTVLTDRESPPKPPTSGGGRRADATNPRSVAAELARSADQAERERAERRRARHLAYQDGRITGAQRADMDGRDAPLAEIPGGRGAAFTAAAP